MDSKDLKTNILNFDGNTAIKAGAGTGKTYILVSKFKKDIEDTDNYKVMAAITFTIKAANEISQRLNIDTSIHFIGTNNSFATEEVIKPFFKDVYEFELDKPIDTDYSNESKANNFSEALEHLKSTGKIGTYRDNSENFIFQLTLDIVKKSKACRLYLRAKYCKIFIDEYQDCDNDMHEFFKYLNTELGITLFVVGDPNQSIYEWRGANPKLFESILTDEQYKVFELKENFRSSIEIQNYTNFIFSDGSSELLPVNNENPVILISSTPEKWPDQLVDILNPDNETAILRYSNSDAEKSAEQINSRGKDFTFIKKIPIDDIRFSNKWFYTALAKLTCIDSYSEYDYISEIPVEGDNDDAITYMRNLKHDLKKKKSIKTEYLELVCEVANYFQVKIDSNNMDLLYYTVSDGENSRLIDTSKFTHTTRTIHGAKGLQFDQVVLMLEDYHPNYNKNITNTELNMHYVAASRAKNKLILIDTNTNKSKKFYNYTTQKINNNGLSADKLFKVIG